ncbi:hypothetical protein DPMD02_35 [Desulfofustis phage LS06-2018-MD02]|nr:hypothetical protein DPMD02_35 [Desulfofustis phage LS06-2018-MD02]
MLHSSRLSRNLTNSSTRKMPSSLHSRQHDWNRCGNSRTVSKN